ncbi:glycosyltransferase family 4 protein [Patescibacteria group bacterium]|nr:glycosyltransferase family 4 protein [Patescibacteria group bacterium]MCL5010255.1 glycosyltransferase family 4 protein [Patescibacteria group bacterium]
MRIGIIGTIWYNTPPKGYGGTEEVVYNLVNGLAERGHEVSLFGPSTANTRAKLYPTVDKPLREKGVDWENVSYTLYHLTEAFDRESEFDILHMHLNKAQDYLALPLAFRSKVPVVFTFHFKLPTPDYKPDRYRLLQKYRKLPFISISNSQRGGRDWNFTATVYNGLNIDDFPFCEKAEDYFVWIGKVNPAKGTKEAIMAAKKAGVKLYLMGVVDTGVPELLSYYQEEVKPLVDNKNIIWVGEVGIKEKAKILGGAKAFLNPIAWEEPFGLVMTQSQAVGTPVISFNRGSAPELIINGKTGFLVNDLGEMADKIARVDSLSRFSCRKNVEEHFTIEKMVSGYEGAYRDLINKFQ